MHGFGEHDGTPYYVMQFIPGLGLDAVIDELGRLPAGGRTAEPNKPLTSEQAALSAPTVLARSLLRQDDAGTEGVESPGRNALSQTSVGGSTPDPGPASPARPRLVGALQYVGRLPSRGYSASAAGGGSGKGTTYWESVARIGVQVAEALAYAHA